MELNAHDQAVARAIALRRPHDVQYQRDRNDQDRDAHYAVPVNKPVYLPWTRKPPAPTPVNTPEKCGRKM